MANLIVGALIPESSEWWCCHRREALRVKTTPPSYEEQHGQDQAQRLEMQVQCRNISSPTAVKISAGIDP